jgi:hypothetical protein
MSKTELAVIGAGAGALQTYDDSVFNDLAKGGDYTPRLQLFSKNAEVTSGKIGPGHWGIPDGVEVIDLGKEINVYVLARRPKAMDLSDKEAIIVSYDPESAVFKRIQEESGKKNEDGSTNGCIYGPTFLFYEEASKTFVEFFASSKTSRGVAKKMYAFLPNGKDAPSPMTLGSEFIEKGKYAWHGPTVRKCSTPFEVPVEKANVEIEKFLTQQPNVEVVEGAEKRRAR